MNKTYELKALKSNRLISSLIKLEKEGANIKLLFESENMKLVFIDEYPFFALVKLRNVLDELGILLLCNGARRDVYPSGSSAIGNMAYVMQNGHPAIELVNIFEPINDFKKIASVSEQKVYRDNWIKSL